MLYNFDWLSAGETFPPTIEVPRLQRYEQNAALFEGNHFGDAVYRANGNTVYQPVEVFKRTASRIEQVVGNFDEIVSFPTLLNYQRLMSLKMADLVCGERPDISGATDADNKEIKATRDYTDFDDKLYSTIIDLSRYGDAIWRVYRDDYDKNTFTVWTPTQWYPIVSQDGANTITYHCLCWRENVSKDASKPDWKLHVQKHGTAKVDVGSYTYEVYQLTSNGSVITGLISSEEVKTGFDMCAVTHLRAYAVSNSVYGFDDYLNIDSIMAEIMARVGQISAILDKHADPSLTGPASMLEQNPTTGEFYLKLGKYFAVSQGEDHPEYMTWDGQLDSAFKQLEFLMNQLYILSEMGAALLGSMDGGSNAISGTAMRFKMVNPLAKARRIANALTRPVRLLISKMSTDNDVDASDISVFWADGLPDDPRENIENAKLATGEEKLMPYEEGIMTYFGRSSEEAKKWRQQILDEEAEKQARGYNPDDPNKPGPNSDTGVNPQSNGSTTGMTNFESQTNKEVEP